jgi:hypothetical protein
MKRGLILSLLVTVGVAVGLAVWFVGLPERSTQIVSSQYNFSVSFPDAPTVTTESNDEGLPKTMWVLKHDHMNWVEYFQVSGTCYHETLDPEKEFPGADQDPVLVLNGLEVVDSKQFQLTALETGRSLPAFSRVTKGIGNDNKGELCLHKSILDGQCMIDAGARADNNYGPASLFIESVKILK